MAPRYLRSFVLPNHHVPGWAEADVFEVTKAGYFREYEIKTSVSDFKKDSTKTVWVCLLPCLPIRFHYKRSYG